MSLRINNNAEALNAHRNLAKNDQLLAKSIERLSSGQKINRGADGPASLVISEGLRAQVASLQQATENSESAISIVQTAEGALNEVSRLLVDIRQRSVAAANVGVNDTNMTAASQTEIENALNSIDRIARSTQFGGELLLNGNAEADGSTGASEAAEAASAAGVDGAEEAAELAKVAEATGGSEESAKLLTFQIGANKGQTASIALPSVVTDQLAKGVTNESGFQSLADLDVTTSQGAQDALAVVDKAIAQITIHRGNLGAFQKNTLESNLTSLRVATENLTAAESNIRDADVAVELAAFTRNQIMTQSATAQLAQANAMPQNVARLLSAQ
jgi:flagellin